MLLKLLVSTFIRAIDPSLPAASVEYFATRIAEAYEVAMAAGQGDADHLYNVVTVTLAQIQAGEKPSLLP